MDYAFNKETKEIVPAMAIHNDPSYFLPKNDEWTTSPDEIVNYDEVLKNNNIGWVSCRYKNGFVRSYTNKQGELMKTPVRPHFFIPNKEKLGVVMVNETKAHKDIKDFIFNLVSDKEDVDFTYLSLNEANEKTIIKTKLKDLDIDWFKLKMSTKESFFETSITDTFNTRRVDVLIPFKKRNHQLGLGLAFEVQLSEQSAEVYKKRTVDRGLKGFSTVWLDKSHFESINPIVLKDKIINLYSMSSVIHTHLEELKLETLEIVQKCSREMKKLNMAGALCPKCKTGLLTMKKSYQYGRFLGCTNYPSCRITANLD